ncbi:alpha/beta hydrolase [Paraburkholderia guartelaensis]|uniref:Alpha/beta hydrolase n=1 Tax=Paraburkholderia guartelaensis TaxID=2546446 RepID=A0A4R5LJY7_9BURK|nr:alpha/beta hydrolase [Paraburkholderia guartelaensis]TDG09932.1 alpha/beta hydrolase [Paraburkholderia guartelaensis]
MYAFTQSFIETNGVRLSVATQGAGPLVLLLHGFPETSYAWRHQLMGLSNAGFRAVAPDLRGFGLSDCPIEPGRYTTLDIIGDLVGIMDALGEKNAVVVGNDWGATIAWQAALLRPDRFRAVVALGVPMMGRAPISPSRIFPQTEQAWFYTHYFSQPGQAESELELDVAATLRKLYFWASGDAGPRDQKTPNPFGLVARQAGLLGALPEPASPPTWLDKADFDAFVRAYKASGFRGGLNYYRNLDRNWELQAAFNGLPVQTPALYLVGEYDTGLAIPGMREIIGDMRKLVPNLRDSQIIKRAGHWLQQEAPDLVNTAVIEFLRNL